MKIDPLQQYAKLKQQLLQERAQLEARLAEIKQVLGDEGDLTPSPSAQVREPASPRRGRRPAAGNKMSLRDAVMSALANGPVARKDLVKAVEGVGYKFTTRNPLNSIGSILYAKNTPVKNKGGTFFVEGGAQEASSKNGHDTETADTETRPRRKKRTMSPEARERIAAAQRARWAKQKRNQ